MLLEDRHRHRLTVEPRFGSCSVCHEDGPVHTCLEGCYWAICQRCHLTGRGASFIPQQQETSLRNLFDPYVHPQGIGTGLTRAAASLLRGVYKGVSIGVEHATGPQGGTVAGNAKAAGAFVGWTLLGVHGAVCHISIGVMEQMIKCNSANNRNDRQTSDSDDDDYSDRGHRDYSDRGNYDHRNDWDYYSDHWDDYNDSGHRDYFDRGSYDHRNDWYYYNDYWYAYSDRGHRDYSDRGNYDHRNDWDYYSEDWDSDSDHSDHNDRQTSTSDSDHDDYSDRGHMDSSDDDY
eukprot:TRINITY_DN17415_c0_g1_i1.p1 TRINITY_DN17415_c0_g1~~TRINITY_DN17415_c0_g1_i1.p1  ORF type:complete len:289 (+),score=12.63 TRINITY_DN17415_c0_g1_i1:56-922(+)